MRLIIQYIFEMIPYCFIGMIIYLVIRICRIRKQNENVCWSREICRALFVAYCAGIASQTILPRWDAGIDSGTGLPYLDIYVNTEIASINLRPFKTILDQINGNISNVDAVEVSKIAILNLSANLLLFFPLGIFLPMLFAEFKSIKNTIQLGVVLCICVEIIQIFIGRSCDIDDVILNVLGITLGFLTYTCASKLFRKLYS